MQQSTKNVLRLLDTLDAIGNEACKRETKAQKRNYSRIQARAEKMKSLCVSMYDGETQHHRMKKHCKRGGLEKISCGSVMATRRFDGSRITCVYKTHRF